MKRFLFDTCLLPFAKGHRDPEEALSACYDTIKPLIDKHAPIQHKRAKAIKSCPLLTHEVIREMTKRDQLKRIRRSNEYKKQRNYVSNVVEKKKELKIIISVIMESNKWYYLQKIQEVRYISK